MMAAIDERLADLDSEGYHGSQIDRLALQAQFAACYAGNIDQVVYETHHLLDLAFHHRAYFGKLGLADPDFAHDLHAVADGSQRVAQFMRQRCEELVLAPIGLTELVFSLLAFGNILGRAVELERP